MDPSYYSAIAGAVIGAAAGMVVACALRTSADAERDAVLDDLRCGVVKARLRTEAAERAKQEARAETAHERAALHRVAAAASRAEKEAGEARRKIKELEKQLEAERRKHKHTKKTMRRKRKVRDVVARGAKRMNRRPFPDRGNGSKRSKFTREPFSLNGEK